MLWWRVGTPVGGAIPGSLCRPLGGDTGHSDMTGPWHWSLSTPVLASCSAQLLLAAGQHGSHMSLHSQNRLSNNKFLTSNSQIVFKN